MSWGVGCRSPGVGSQIWHAIVQSCVDHWKLLRLKCRAAHVLATNEWSFAQDHVQKPAADPVVDTERLALHEHRHLGDCDFCELLARPSDFLGLLISEHEHTWASRRVGGGGVGGHFAPYKML